jgi:hypothetical protein
MPEGKVEELAIVAQKSCVDAILDRTSLPALLQRLPSVEKLVMVNVMVNFSKIYQFPSIKSLDLKGNATYPLELLHKQFPKLKIPFRNQCRRFELA